MRDLYQDISAWKGLFSHDVPHLTVMGVQHSHVLRPTLGTIKFSSLNSLEITLKPDMGYNIGIFDPKFSMISMNHKIVPRAYLHLNQYMGDVTMQLEVREGLSPPPWCWGGG